MQIQELQPHQVLVHLETTDPAALPSAQAAAGQTADLALAHKDVDCKPEDQVTVLVAQLAAKDVDRSNVVAQTKLQPSPTASVHLKHTATLKSQKSQTKIPSELLLSLV
jgi:hypothetical protein